MSSFEKSSETKSCIKANCTQTLSTDLSAHQYKAAYRTPKNYQLAKKMLKKMPDRSKTIFF